MRYPYFFLSLMTGSLLFAGCSSSDDSGGTTTGTGGTTTGAGGTTTGAGGTTTGAGGSTTGSGGSTGSTDGTYIEAADAGLTVGVGAYDYGDTGGSTVTLTNPTDGTICAEGTAALTGEGLYDTVWGGGIAVSLAEDGSSFDASGYTGFSFTISDAPVGDLRVGVTNASDSSNAFFTTSITEGANTLVWADLAQGEWVTPAGTLDLSAIKDIQFQVASNDSAAIPFNFCISNLSLTGGGNGEAGGPGL